MSADPLTYAVGDIHGCADLLDALLDRIEAHAGGRPRNLVFLGDYVDRGPDSARVIETLRGLRSREPERVVCLMGNHEQLMLEAYRTGLGAEVWRENGGEATLTSYGVADPEALPHAALAWLSGLPTVHADDLRYYVHAGFRPGRPGIDPDERTHLWIREPFLSSDFDFGRYVVHGHTPQKDGRPDVRAHRLNLDTAAVYGGALTAGVFAADQARALDFLQVQAADLPRRQR